MSKSCSVTSGVPQGSVLGPLLFNIYLQSLLDELKKHCPTSFIYAFADDVKILGPSKQELQHALDIIEKWSQEYELPIQPKKSEHLSFSFSKTVSDPQFYINNTKIPQSNNVTDLGITLTKSLKWNNHISQITARANTICYSILRAFYSRNIKLMINLYKTYARPTLEYNTSIWTPNLKSDILLIEKVQRNFTKIICQKNNIKFTSYAHRLEILKLESLELRRVKFDILLMFKIYHQLIEINFEDFFSNTLGSRNYNLRGHDKQLHTPRYPGTTIRNNFFSHRVISYWNKLPPEIINCANLDRFKINLNKIDFGNIYSSNFQ